MDQKRDWISICSARKHIGYVKAVSGLNFHAKAATNAKETQ